jgi:hypothetical protein
VDWVRLPEDAPAFAGYYDMQRLWPEESRRRFEAVRHR